LEAALTAAVVAVAVLVTRRAVTEAVALPISDKAAINSPIVSSSLRAEAAQEQMVTAARVALAVEVVTNAGALEGPARTAPAIAIAVAAGVLAERNVMAVPAAAGAVPEVPDNPGLLVRSALAARAAIVV
jgi:hypothetical protein